MAQPVISGNPFANANAMAYAMQKTDTVLKALTLKEKVGQMNTQGRFYLKVLRALISGKGLPLMSIGENKDKQIPGAVFMDGPRGVVVKGHTNFPCAMARAATWNTELEKRIGETMGNDAIHAGANLLGAPCMNLLRNPRNGRAQEAYGEDPFLTGSMACALVSGVQSRGIMATAKHYALNSIENSRFVVDVQIDKRTLHEVYLPHFKMVADAGIASFMSAYNKVNGKYCDENHVLLTEILRNMWGYKGFVHSDWMLGTHATAASIKAGMNVEMPNPKYYKYGKVKRAIRKNELTGQDINALIQPTLLTKFLFQYFRSKQQMPEVDTTYLANTALALEAAQEATVLLKNDNNTLPFDLSKVKVVALAGYLSDKENDGDRGSSYSRSEYVITPLQAFANYLKGHGITLLHIDGANADTLKAICAKADVVITVAGISVADEGEYMTLKSAPKKPGKKEKYMFGLRLRGGGDRDKISLHQRDINVIETAAASGKPQVVMLMGGSAITMEEWKSKVPAIIMSWYHGMEGARAMPQVVFGEVNPSGKLPFTIPVNENDLPAQGYAPESIVYDYYHGYTLFEKKSLPIAFPFGYGLSYTGFEIGEPVFAGGTIGINDSVAVTVKVKNTGKVAGKEVAQLYISCPQSKVDRPNKILRAFDKVALQPGEEKEVTLKVPVKSLAYFDVNTDTWVVEKTTYTAWVGNSSEQKNLKRVQFEVK